MSPLRKKIESASEIFKSPLDGTSLQLYTDRVNDPIAHVVFVHGFADHARRYEHLTAALCKAAFNVYRLDLRGHGASSGPRGFINDFDEYLSDVHESMLRWKASCGDDKPWILIGHSMGGLVVGRYLEVYPRDFFAAVMMSPFLGMRIKVPAWKQVMAKVAARLLPSLSLPNEIDPNILTHDRTAAEAYREDPLVFTNANAKWFVSILEAQRQGFEDVEKVSVPLLVMQAADDMLVEPEETKRFYGLVGKPEKELRMYDDCYHELMQELGKDRIIKEMIAWMYALLPDA